MLNSLKLVQPTTVHDASRALAELGDKAKLYAGGAELLLLMRQGLLDAEVLVDLKKIDRLHGLELANGALRIGACVTHRELESHPLVRDHASALAYAESQVANIRVRHQGTLGGNLAFNDPHSDPGTVLLLHDASVVIGNDRGERRIGLEEFFVDMYATALDVGDLLLEVEAPLLPDGMASAYRRLHRYQRPTLGVAAAVRLDNRTIAEARLAVGCVGPKPLRLPELEGKLGGVKVADAGKLIAEEKKTLRELLRPVDDLLGSAEYKLHMTEVMLGDAIEQASQER